jgi:carbon-monoxide dehydrogenase medium subunit
LRHIFVLTSAAAHGRVFLYVVCSSILRNIVSFVVHEPSTLAEALGVLAHEGDACAPLAGGTDLLLGIRRRARKYRSVVNIKFIPGLGGLDWDSATGLTIGALTTFRAIETGDHVRSRFPALVEAARVVAGVQLRNLATIGGNLGNASPSADSAPPLVALGATIEIVSAAGARAVPVENCLTGPGRTVLRHGELFTRISIPASAARGGSAYARFSPRSAMDIGIASVAASIALDADQRCTSCRIALGAVAPVPLRSGMAEGALEGERLTPALIGRAAELAAAAARPITDIRGTADYRKAIVKVLAARVLAQAAARAERMVS